MRILVGSKYFFSSYQDFKPKDEDYIEFYDVEQQRVPDVIHENNTDIFMIMRKDKHAIIEQALNAKKPDILGMFIVPEFCKEIGFEPSDLPLIEKLKYRLDEKHKYERMIYDFYVSNGSFSLTEQQRLIAYNEYKRSRPKIYGSDIERK